MQRYFVMSFATDGFDVSASPAVCRRVPGIRPKRKFLALSNLKGIEWNSLWLAEVSAAVCLFSQIVLRHCHGPLLRQYSSYFIVLVELVRLLLDLVQFTDNCS